MNFHDKQKAVPKKSLSAKKVKKGKKEKKEKKEKKVTKPDYKVEMNFYDKIDKKMEIKL